MADPAFTDPRWVTDVPAGQSPGGSPAVPASPPPPPAADRRRRGSKALFEWFVIIVATVLVTLVVKTFLVQAFYIPTGSMAPTLKPGDRVLVTKALYSVNRGDVIVFKKPPTDHSPGATDDLIKRVIGLPGDRVSGRGGYVYIDGRKLDEHWLPAVDQGVTSAFGPDTVAQGEYFVMGDNRTNSEDSRFIGDIPASTIVGKTFVRIWPPLSMF
ncbi:MAG: signal peptidase I [Acidimicrobiales bacterium]